MPFSHAPYNLTAEGYANLTGANISTDQPLADAKRTTARVDGGLRLLGLYGDAKGTRFGVRVEFESAKERSASTGERTLLVLGSWGRVEFGKRQGLPDVLSGYAPNTYTFTSAEFGIASGPRLDPGGTLPALFLPRALPRALAAQINSISILGFANTLAGDRSTKVIYVSPKVRGFEGAASFSPQASDQNGRFRNLLQTGLVHESYFGIDVFRVGGSFTYATGRRDPLSGEAIGDPNSASAGLTYELNEMLDLGLSATFDGHTGLRRTPLAERVTNRAGYVASVLS